MQELLATLFVHPMTLVGWHKTVMLMPLCLAIALVYKGMKCERPAEVPLASLILWFTVVVGMYAVGVGLWGLYMLIV